MSALPVDGTFPSGTAQWEKRNIAQEIPVWDENICIQCGKCVLVCPHAVIRAKVYRPRHWQDAPETFKRSRPAGRNLGASALHAAGGAGGLHRLLAVLRGLPGQEQERDVERKAINMAAAAAVARSRERATGIFS